MMRILTIISPLLIILVGLITSCQGVKQEMIGRGPSTRFLQQMMRTYRNGIHTSSSSRSSGDGIDVLNEQGLRKGYVLARKKVHEKGEIHRAVHLYLFDKEGKNVLLQKRAANVDHYPNKYSISVVGHADAGECSHMAVKRELKEELGIHSDQLDIVFLFSFRQDATLSPTYVDRQINDLYVCYIDPDHQTINFDKKDISAIQWVSFERFQKMVEDASSGQGDLAPVYANSCKDLIYFLSHKQKNNYY